jgi:hypothetical protein
VLPRTNWPESGQRHFAVVIAVDKDSVETEDSNEVHWPSYPPDHVMLYWSTRYPSVKVISSDDAMKPVAQWAEYATVLDATNFSTNIDFNVFGRFFAIDKACPLSMSLFNPNP